MSEQKGSFLSLKNSYHFNRQRTHDYKSKSIDPSKFNSWQTTSMYKSSYANFHSKASIEPKSTVIPGYSGYVPYINSENLYAKGYTPLTKDSFSSPKLGKNFNGLSTNGFNVRKETFLNHSKFGESCKYGKTGIQKAHPAWKENIWTSTIKDTYKNPKALNNPVFRQTDKLSETMKASTRSSGFAVNHSYLDGKGWNPDRVLMGDNKRTQYRDLYNRAKQFHRNTFLEMPRVLKKKELNYKYN